ncbi:uncharacterized protein EV422DRAFT_67942 [Fimicolochytrium jonesii]|uniref:uncharacterized protein n=1 Tax=Fimicolochytrium jonesii TaxID=1396493 RepID=UPI0022FEB68B|nr:uncharacterized protein EV422DRAFT_67942 [Fimicolochytrium jonesii]KAI8820366.1 hypothetical protein EV422DRAFT_67942 [Fimicolochytrium jonesii]
MDAVQASASTLFSLSATDLHSATSAPAPATGKVVRSTPTPGVPWLGIPRDFRRSLPDDLTVVNSVLGTSFPTTTTKKSARGCYQPPDLSRLSAQLLREGCPPLHQCLLRAPLVPNGPGHWDDTLSLRQVGAIAGALKSVLEVSCCLPAHPSLRVIALDCCLLLSKLLPFHLPCDSLLDAHQKKVTIHRFALASHIHRTHT